MSELVCYRSNQIEHIWRYAKPYIQRALDRGSRYTLEDIYEGLLETKFQMWTSQNEGFEAVLITTIQDGYCLLLLAGGDNLENWVVWLPIVEKWAKENGAQEMRIYGRVGWARKINYKIEYAKMTKAL